MNTKKLLSFILALLLLPVFPVSADYTSISPSDALKMMSPMPPLYLDGRIAIAGEVGATNAIVVDVRTPAEYEEGHILSAINIPVESITEPPSELPDPDQVILIYCRSGRRSKEAAAKLDSYGYKNVYEFGGIIDWEGEIVTTDYETALQLIREGNTQEAAEILSGEDDTQSMILLGMAYLASVPPAYEEASVLFRRAGEAGEAVGFYNLAQMYANGLLNVGNPCTDDLDKLNYDKACEYYMKAASMGDTLSMIDLAELHLKYGNDKEAVDCYVGAAEAGVGAGMVGAARCYEYGIGVPKDTTVAEKYYEMALDCEVDDVVRAARDGLARLRGTA